MIGSIIGLVLGTLMVLLDILKHSEKLYMTWLKFIYDFLHFAESKGGYRSDDTPYSDQAILNYLIPARSTILKKIKDYSDNMFQVLPCIELEEADQELCPKSAMTGCIWLRSVKPVPNTLKVSNLSNPNYDNIDYRRLDKLNSTSRLPSANTSDYYTFVKEIEINPIFIIKYHKKS